MSPTPKIFQTGAMKMEYGLDGVNQSGGWLDTNSARTLGASDAFPWTSFGNAVNIAKEEDNSVTTKAFKTNARMVGKTVENALAFPARFKGLNRFHYWMWGFENAIQEVVVFKAAATPFSAAVAAGETFQDVDLNNYLFLRVEKIRGVDAAQYLYIFEATDSVAPTLATGTLTETGGDATTFDFTSHSAVMYEHLFEIDSEGRAYRNYTTAEQSATGAIATDKRNLMCTLAKRMKTYDLRYRGAVSKGFSFKCSAAGLAMWESTYMAYEEQRGDYSSDTWTLTDGLCDNKLVPAHFELRFQIGETITYDDGEITGLELLGLTEVDLTVDTPLQTLQDTVSGLSIVEPELEGKYDIQVTGTISRHSSNVYQQYRDDQTELVAHLAANQGWYMQEFMFKKCTLSSAGPDEGDIAQEPLSMDAGFVCDETENQFATNWLYGITETQKSPVLFRVRDDSNVNSMLQW